jgi:hypothetical protein
LRLLGAGGERAQVSVMRVSALAVIGEHLDDTALIDAAVAAALDHLLQFRLQRIQTADTLLDLDETCLGDGIGGGAGGVRQW